MCPLFVLVIVVARKDIASVVLIGAWTWSDAETLSNEANTNAAVELDLNQRAHSSI
jgi:hypothetical protein